jgi:hypothetical protein
MSKLGWFITIAAVACVLGVGVAGYVFYKYRLRVSPCPSEIRIHGSSVNPVEPRLTDELFGRRVVVVVVVHGLGDHVHHVPVHAAGQPEQREPASAAARFGGSEVTSTLLLHPC